MRTKVDWAFVHASRRAVSAITCHASSASYGAKRRLPCKDFHLIGRVFVRKTRLSNKPATACAFLSLWRSLEACASFEAKSYRSQALGFLLEPVFGSPIFVSGSGWFRFTDVFNSRLWLFFLTFTKMWWFPTFTHIVLCNIFFNRLNICFS